MQPKNVSNMVPQQEFSLQAGLASSQTQFRSKFHTVWMSVLQPQLLHSVDWLLFIFTVLRGWIPHSPLTPQQAGLRLQKLIFFCHVKNLILVLFSYSFSLFSFQAICACVLCQREQKGLKWNEIGENYARLRRNLGSMHRDKNMEPTERESLRK